MEEEKSKSILEIMKERQRAGFENGLKMNTLSFSMMERQTIALERISETLEKISRELEERKQP